MNPTADSRPAASKPSTPLPQPRSLVTWSLDPDAYCSAHEHATRNDLARRLAALKGCAYAGAYDDRYPYARAPYFVPSNTVTDPGVAQGLGIDGVHDLFGGVVPHAFIATKAITHPVGGPEAPRPAGWCPRFAAEIAGSALDGFSCFSREEARRAGARCSPRGWSASSRCAPPAAAARSSRAAPGRWTAASMPWTRPTSPPTAS
jgi:hypothetical protein